MLKKVLITINILALIAASLWFISNLDWEPLITILGLITSLIVLLAKDSNKKPQNIKLSQKSGDNSINIQGAHDITISKK